MDTFQLVFKKYLGLIPTPSWDQSLQNSSINILREQKTEIPKFEK